MSETCRANSLERIAEGRPRQAGIRWPEGVEMLLVDLVDRANSAGARTTRKEMVAALLVQSSHVEAGQLRDIVLAYRQALTCDVANAVPGHRRPRRHQGGRSV